MSLPIVATAQDRPGPWFAGPEERWRAGDATLDYCLLPYDAPRAPSLDAWRNVNLLYASFAEAGVETEGREIVERLRTGLGAFRTVWGIKRHAGTGATSWELYFYDHRREAKDLSIARVRELLAPVVNVDAEEPQAIRWLMFSVEFTADDLRRRNPVAAHLYVMDTGLSYELKGREFTFESIYRFLDPRTEIREVLRLLERSVHLDRSKVLLSEVLPPELVRAYHVCVANKRTADAVYFSRVSTAAFAWFLERHGWPEYLRSIVTHKRAQLAHHLWDVGFDFRAVSGGIELRKSGVYGVF